MAKRSSLKNLFNLVDSANSVIPPEKAFLNDLKRSIELTDKKNKRVGSRSYKPSGMKCMRQSYYVITGAKEDDTEDKWDSIGICQSGTDRHERIQQAVLDMQSNGMNCKYLNVADYVREHKLDEYLDIVKEPNFEAGDYETKLYHKTLNLSFLCDGIIDYNNHYYILEIKTESSFKFDKRTGVDPAHYTQATAYSTVFGINEVLFLYENRDTLNKKTYILEVTNDMKQEFVGYIDECDQYIARKEVPPVVGESKACYYCHYKELCRQEG